MYKGPLDILFGYGSFRIVSNLSWWPIFLISGFDPVGYNALSFSMFLLDALIFYFMCRELLGKIFPAALAAILFGGGAVGADALFWKCSNNTIICFFFYMLTLIFYLQWRNKKSAYLWAASLATFLLAMLSKEEAASLPGIIILLELLFFGERRITVLVKRVAPYTAIIIAYLAFSPALFHLVGREPEPNKFFQLRPLHTLLTPWTVFSLPPDGLLQTSSPFLYLIPTVLFATIFFISEKKELCFAFGWVFLTFVPQSLTSLGQTTPKYLFNSISRYLFLPSAGAALALAIVLAAVMSRWGRKIGISVTVIVTGVYLTVNHFRVQERGQMWRDNAEPIKVFLKAMKGAIPRFPPNSHVAVVNGPIGRAYTEQALRASYGNPDITWIIDAAYRPKQGEHAYFVSCNWWQDNSIRINVEDFVSAMSRLYPDQ